MNLRPPPFLVLAAALVLSAATIFAAQIPASPLQQERVAAAHLIALGRAATPAEIEQGVKQGELTVAALVAHHQAQLKSNAALQHATALKAFTDAFGRVPTSAELTDSNGAGNGVYSALVKHHTEWLSQHPAEYKEVLNRAYEKVIRRGVYDEEVNYWKPHGTLPFVLLVGCIDHWGRRNQPGLMVTAGTPTLSATSVYLTTVRVSPAIAEEARAVVGLPTATATDFTYASNRTVIASGAENIVAGGRIHFVVSGAPDLVPTEAAK